MRCYCCKIVKMTGHFYKVFLYMTGCLNCNHSNHLESFPKSGPAQTSPMKLLIRVMRLKSI